MRILAGIDGTERSFHAVEFGSQMLSEKVDDIIMFFSPPKLSLSSKSELSPDLPELTLNALAESVFSKAKLRLPKPLQEMVQTIVGDNRSSNPSEGILAAAEQSQADLILIGAHSATRRLRFFVGGTARKIAYQSNLPVMLVRESQSPSHKTGFNVLIACDERDQWRDEVAVLRDFSWPAGSKASLFHVVETMDEEHFSQIAKHAEESVPLSMNLIEEYRSNVAKQKAAWMDTLQASRESMPSIIKEAATEVGHGHVVEAIVHKVHDSQIDLVVVGSRRLGGIRRLLGGTTEGLLTQCPCSLLIVHE